MEQPAERIILAEGRHVRLIQSGRWEYAERIHATGTVVLVALTADRRLILTEQYRVPMGRTVIELPAGIVGDIAGEEDEALATAAARELEEETGYQASEMTLLASGPPSAGLATEIVTFFQAGNLTRVGAGGGVEHEDIRVHEVPLEQIEAWLCDREAEGLLIDPKVYVGLYFVLKDRRNVS